MSSGQKKAIRDAKSRLEYAANLLAAAARDFARAAANADELGEFRSRYQGEVTPRFSGDLQTLLYESELAAERSKGLQAWADSIQF